MTYTKDTLRQIFQQPFNQQEWQQMLRHYFHAKELKAEPESINGTSDDEKGYYLGTLDTTDNYRIGLFYYQIQHGNVARKRVGLRNLVKSFINPNWGDFDAALVVFDSGSVWRLSFVCDIKGENTAAKRFSYVFGESDNYYNTPVGRFDALQRNGISFENIKDAFSVEALSKEFFDKYREHYANIVCYITGKRYVKEKGKWVEKTIQEPCYEIFDQFVASFKNPEKTVRDYIKKLMGRLVFIQFLQKKGWLGVPTDNGDWTGGDPRFLQNKFNEFTDKDNFIDGCLEPLFNDLNSNRVGDKASPQVGKNIKIPFLNGGLFQLDEEDCADVRLPHELLGALLDFFEQYNFTIDENDPNDAQIGVDPEMLGRVFENLLEDNKDKGAFYTPKEIVQYMCRESLIAYLQTGIEDKTDKESIRQFVLTHEVERLSSMAEDISIKLLNVKICDPAIGSGAFPMGLLRELYLCQCAIHPELVEKNAADIKRHIIQNNIYGVDIEKGAVDIARLRFWLSLIVDEDSPKFLPNLDFKIMQGNSLLEQYKGVDLSKMTTLSSEQQGGTQLTWFDNMLDVLRLDLRQKLDDYYNCPDHHRKEQLKNEIIDNVKQQLREQSINVDFGELDLSANDQFTLWHTWFYDVFSQGGFDIVIGNPPYGAKLSEIEKKKYKELYADVHMRTPETFCYFTSLAFRLCSKVGAAIVSYIVPNNIFFQNENEKTRKVLSLENMLIRAINLGDNTFENADVPTCIFVAKAMKVRNYDIAYSDYRNYNVKRIKWDDNIENINVEKLQTVPAMVLGMSNTDIDILNSIKDSGIVLDIIADEVASGISSGGDKIFKVTDEIINEYNIEKDILRPVLVGSDINKYQINYTGDKIIYTKRETNISDYPFTKDYLIQFMAKLGQRSEARSGILPWYSLNRNRYESLFSEPKIIMRQTSDSIITVFDGNGYYVLDSILVLKIKNETNWNYKFVSSILNSKVINYLYKILTQEEGRTFAQVKPINVRKLYIPKATVTEQELLSILYDYMT
jgi:type I restriction-modification system DNA methylase subunit